MQVWSCLGACVTSIGLVMAQDSSVTIVPDAGCYQRNEKIKRMRTLTKLLAIRAVVSWLAHHNVSWSQVNGSRVSMGYFLSLVIPESLLCFTLQYKRCLCGSHGASRKPAGKSEDSTKIPPFPVLLTVLMLSLFSSCLAPGHSPRLTLQQRQKVLFMDWKLELQFWVTIWLTDVSACLSPSSIFLQLIPILGSVWH